ncbi:glycosyl transferase [Aliarcobacter trophiarum]|uniref:glycosyl transferase n=1 Tax=Aliarcobacter trophiarum TaxID=708186 RepID=UPI00100AE91B|nr:glycosyl transferase [Aliarcobacter trophiarum]RXI27541.1 glycosyl transferase [Aliarcobacter trophiarum]
MDFKIFLKAVGTGPKGNRDLTLNESFEAISQILNKEPTQAQIGAFLIAWRVKLETIEEFKGAIKALNSFIKYKEVPDSLMLGYSFDGRDTNPYLFPLYEDILDGFFKKNSDVRRLNLVISGDLVQPTKNGICTKDIFTKFDKGQYLHYFDRVEYLQELSELTPLRREFGLRTAFNTVEKLLNPSLSEYGICGAFHKPYVSKYIDMYRDDFKDITVVRGAEGDIEVFKDSKFWQKKDDQIVEFEFCLKDYGVNYSKVFENITLEDNLNILKNYDDEILNLAKFNVALYLLFAKRVSSLDEAWQRLN